MTLYVASMKDKIPSNAILINTTSRSNTWTKHLSPFFVGPVEIYPGLVSKNCENGWQFSKIYFHHLNTDGSIKDEYFEWANQGYNDSYAHRYPMGKGMKPEFSIKYKSKDEYDRLSYIEARKELYIPFYKNAVINTDAFKKLKELYIENKIEYNKDMYLQEFDGYNSKKFSMDYDDVINCETKKMGHSFVLAMMLEGVL
jgi:hypothetical protein